VEQKNLFNATIPNSYSLVFLVLRSATYLDALIDTVQNGTLWYSILHRRLF